MPIFFDYDKLASLYSTPKKRLEILQSLAQNKYFGKNITGSSYLLNTDILFKRYPPAQLDHYVELASKRNYLDYKFNNFTGLDLELYPEISIQKIKNNPLLELQNKILYFKQEK